MIRFSFAMRVLAALLLALAPRAAGAAPARGVAVVELFSSEGCSSCPPADRLLGQLAAEAHASGQPVYTLEFHVDYWDHLGWRDPFDSHAYTERQQRYAEALESGSLYTPEMVVDGRASFVGSDAKRARGEVAAALARPGAVAVSVTASRESGHRWDVRWRVAGAPHGATLCLALAESGLVSSVARGENAGRTLHHASVVRAFDAVALDGRASGETTLDAPAGVNPAHARVVAFVQEPRGLAVLGAAATP